MTNTAAWLWLRAVLGPASAALKPILELYHTPQAFHAALGKEDVSHLLSPAQAKRLHAAPTEFVALETACRRGGVLILCYGDEAYPKRLRQIDDPPSVLFCTGEMAALQAEVAVGIIGSRRPSAYGVEAAGAISTALANAGACLVSGLADGLDSEAHKAAVKAQAPTIGVLGTAIDKTYPAANTRLRHEMEQHGLILSEYGPGEHTTAHCFLQRNRLIAALSDALCVVEAREKSGTMNTVGHAERYGCAVYAVPGGIFSQLCTGTNMLLAQGRAAAIASPAAFLQQLGLNPAKSEAPAKRQAVPLSGEAQRMHRVLAPVPRSLEALAADAGLNAGQALAALMELEIAALATGCAGGQYKSK